MTRWDVVRCVIASIMGILVAVYIVHAQGPTTYKPTEVQQLKLEVSQRDAWLAQRDWIEAQRRYQEAVGKLNLLGDAIRIENGWPKDVIFNADKLEFSVPPANTARPGAPGPPPALPQKGPLPQ